MLLHQRFIPGLAIASYIIGDEETGQAAAIDVPVQFAPRTVALCRKSDITSARTDP